MTPRRLAFLMMCAAAAATLQAQQISFDRLLRADEEPHNWLTYSGDVQSQRYSRLTQITPANVRNLELQWVFQVPSLEKFEATPLVVDGVMYTVQPPNDVVALDAATGRVFWSYTYTPVDRRRAPAAAASTAASRFSATRCSWARSTATWWRSMPEERASAVERDRAGRPARSGLHLHRGAAGREGQGDRRVGGRRLRHPRVHRGVRCAAPARKLWRFYTMPGPGEPGNETWAGDSWKNGGASIWVTGSYDPELNLTYWGVGNPGPDWNGDGRAGDNLYSDSVVALDADTGQAEVALPVHAARRVRLRRHAGPGAGRHRVAGPAAEGDALGQPQRLLLRARSRHGRVPVGQAVTSR